MYLRLIAETYARSVGDSHPSCMNDDENDDVEGAVRKEGRHSSQHLRDVEAMGREGA